MLCKSFFFDTKSFEVFPQTTLEEHFSQKRTFFAAQKEKYGSKRRPATYLAAILKMTQMSTRFAGCIAELEQEQKREN